jgi:hypothetical protein
MAELSVIQQMQLTGGMTEQHKLLFPTQHGAEKRDRVLILLISIFHSFAQQRYQ